MENNEVRAARAALERELNNVPVTMRVIPQVKNAIAAGRRAVEVLERIERGGAHGKA